MTAYNVDLWTWRERERDYRENAMWKLELLHHKSGNYQKVGERPGIDPSLTPSKGACRQHPDFGLLVSKTVRWYISDVLRQPVRGVLLGSPREPNAEISAGIRDLPLIHLLDVALALENWREWYSGKMPRGKERGGSVCLISWVPRGTEDARCPGVERSRTTQYRRQENI